MYTTSELLTSAPPCNLKKTSSDSSLHIRHSYLTVTENRLREFESLNKGGWIFVDDTSALEGAVLQLVRLVSINETMDPVSLARYQLITLPPRHDILELISMCDSHIRCSSLIAKSFNFCDNIPIIRQNTSFSAMNYILHRIQVNRQLKLLFSKNSCDNFTPHTFTYTFQMTPIIVSSIKRIFRNFPLWQILCSDIQYTILNYVVSDTRHLIRWCGWANDLPELLEDPIGIMCSIVSAYMSSVTSEQIQTWKKESTTVLERIDKLTTYGLGPVNFVRRSEITGNTIIVCSHDKINALYDLIRKIKGVTVIKLNGSSHVLLSDALFHDIIIVPPFIIGMLRLIYFKRIIVCVNRHVFFTGALPRAQHRWFCRQRGMPSERECTYVRNRPNSKSILQFEKNMIIV